MRRCLSIALMLLVWSAQSGVVLAAHGWDGDGIAGRHDESKCRVCAAVHAPAIHAAAPSNDVSQLVQTGTLAVTHDSAILPTVALIHPSRGPPRA